MSYNHAGQLWAFSLKSDRMSDLSLSLVRNQPFPVPALVADDEK
jgi:hypothetical protein